MYCDVNFDLDPGALNVYFLYASSNKPDLKWTLSNNQGDVWWQGKVDLQSDEEFQVSGTYICEFYSIHDEKIVM